MPSEQPSAGVTPTPTVVDLLGPPPASGEEAEQALRRYFGTATPACDETLKTRWDIVCADADLDGDGKVDLALLIPLAGPGLRSPDPAAVLVRRAAGTGFDRFPASRTEADDSLIGREMFGTADRTGDTRPELVYLTRSCTASTCQARVEIQSWDGTAWRDVGPSDPGIENLETASFTGAGSDSSLTLRGGHLTSLGAGPSRARTVTYRFDGARYAVTDAKQDSPEYLYHAILDADALFQLEQFPEAIAAYRGAIDSPTLKDWKYEDEGHNGRAELYAYALFRIAIATAAEGQNPTTALDQVIMAAQDELFERMAVAFRQGYQLGGSPQHGCLQVTSYLATPPLPDRIDEMFDYGTANPGKSTLDICPF
ncbi:MAG: hypothetical protein WD557_04155 [Dehalococcoidia bacterium]